VERQALYYPYIRVPEAAWFTRVLLYWDQVGTILPESLEDRDSVVGEYTAALLDAGLVEPVRPAEYLAGIPDYAERFFEIVDADPEIQAMRDAPLDQARVGLIHEEKLTEEMFYGLDARRLAERSGEGMWWNVEARTAGIYMAYLATALGALEALRMDPVSDSTSYFVSAPETPVARAEALRLGFLDEILPGPERPVPARDLIGFKEQWSEELNAFRTLVESELLRIALIEDAEARTREKALTEERLRREIDDVASAMSRRRWPQIVFGTVAGLASVATTAIAAAGTGGAALAFAAPGVISGAYAAVRGLPRDRLPDSPLAFAATAQRLG
jgi:Family of unknown function (DUF6236)